MNITYDAKSFFINGKREWLFLGEIHYFRFPKEEWRKVIRMAKAAGINAITTYLAWNYHENREGVFDFSGDRNFAEFIDIAKDEGMYVFLRPGPYICAEWCGGGIPPWILNYENLEIRVDEETFMRCSVLFPDLSPTEEISLQFKMIMNIRGVGTKKERHT